MENSKRNTSKSKVTGEKGAHRQPPNVSLRG